LIRSELVPFDVGNHFPLPVDDRGMERVVHQTFLGKEVHSEQVTDAPHVTDRPSKEVPGGLICLPLGGILRQNLGRIVNRVERDSQQDKIASELRLEMLLEYGEVTGNTQAELPARLITLT
jgi:hypothetical protein